MDAVHVNDDGSWWGGKSWEFTISSQDGGISLYLRPRTYSDYYPERLKEFPEENDQYRVTFLADPASPPTFNIVGEPERGASGAEIAKGSFRLAYLFENELAKWTPEVRVIVPEKRKAGNFTFHLLIEDLTLAPPSPSPSPLRR